MTLQHQLYLLGSMSGGAALAAGLATVTALGPKLGPPLGGFAALGAATLCTTAACRVVERQVLVRLAQSVGPQDEPDEPPLPRHLTPALDERLTELEEVRSRCRRLELAEAEVAHLARAFWTAVNRRQGAVEPPVDALQCLTGLFDFLRQTAEALLRYGASLEEANERMAQGAIDQSDTVSRTTTTVEALSEKIDRISRNAGDATDACGRASQEARRGLEQVHRVTEGMERLQARIETNGRKARRLGDRSVEIGTIVELIRGISSRTDMLALNATIESVRAGEHGRGFAVVAEEIRKLAERTAAATREIGTLVEAIQADTNQSIRALVEEQEEVTGEAERVREAGAALERISLVAADSALLVEGISRSSHDQVLAAQDLVRAMQRISDVSHLTLERTAQSRESIRGLTQWCERLSPIASSDSRRNGRPAPPRSELSAAGPYLPAPRASLLAASEVAP